MVTVNSFSLKRKICSFEEEESNLNLIKQNEATPPSLNLSHLKKETKTIPLPILPGPARLKPFLSYFQR